MIFSKIKTQKAPFIVCIDGLIGAGKSTLLKNLASDYKCFPEPTEEWTLLPYLHKDFKFYGSAFQLQVLLSQMVQRQSFPSDGLIILERCPWISRRVFVPLLLDEDFLPLYYEFYESFKYDVNYFIYLNLDPEEAFRRIQERKSPGDHLISQEYLNRLHDSYTSKLLSGRSNVLVIDAALPEKEVERHVRNILVTLNCISK